MNAGWWLDFGFGLALGALLMAGIFLLELAAGWIRITGTLQTAAPDQSFLLAILIPLIAFLSVGIYEELLTRGYLLQNIAEGLNIGSIGPRGAIVIAWIISAAIFGLLHLGNPNATAISTFNIALAGIFLGLGYVLTGELAIPIGLHITWNFFQGNVFGFPVSGGIFSSTTFLAIEQSGPALWTGGAFGPEAGLLGVLAMLVGSALTVLWVRWRYQHTNLHLPLAHPPVLPTSSTQGPRQEATAGQQPSSSSSGQG
jgi:membrane protease YdiL (CAAX protease family)